MFTGKLIDVLRQNFGHAPDFQSFTVQDPRLHPLEVWQSGPGSNMQVEPGEQQKVW
jgi:hypothetical protein